SRPSCSLRRTCRCSSSFDSTAWSPPTEPVRVTKSYRGSAEQLLEPGNGRLRRDPYGTGRISHLRRRHPHHRGRRTDRGLSVGRRPRQARRARPAGRTRRGQGRHVSVRDVAASVAEIRRCGKERWPVGIFPICPPGMTLDDPDWEPIWAAAQEHDLTVVIHSFTMSIPYPPGMWDNWDNMFLVRS